MKAADIVNGSCHPERQRGIYVIGHYNAAHAQR
jgi:hypothetical protein